MHLNPKAAYLALHGYRCFGYKAGPCSGRIMRGDGNYSGGELMLYLRDDGWVIGTSDHICMYADVGFGVYNDPEWKLLPQKLMEEFCAS